MAQASNWAGGGDEGFDAEFAAAGLQVLADGDDVDACVVKVGEGLFDFIVGLPEAYHEARFDFHMGVSGVLAGVGEKGERSIVGSRVADFGSEGADGLEVVVENFGLDL